MMTSPSGRAGSGGNSFQIKPLIDYRALTRVICQRADVDPTHRHPTKAQRSHPFLYRILTDKRERKENEVNLHKQNYKGCRNYLVSGYVRRILVAGGAE
ncbi:hypothetical protein L1987_24999 [Smallanthus sonchifolius]|uniref:Uncharacterized protein n=1 Tax=Smallanthus sonchifolius TaxID=185202 RepID=A0ACB9ILS3_9ASTR|nr:hypothetical protein L1987_24999 [Smallanthus sonchifolius]